MHGWTKRGATARSPPIYTVCTALYLPAACHACTRVHSMFPVHVNRCSYHPIYGSLPRVDAFVHDGRQRSQLQLTAAAWARTLP